MRFFATASALMATITAAVAQTADFNPVYTPADGQEVAAGAPFEITWSAPAKYADTTVSISLIGGATQATQVKIADIISGIPNTAESYVWNVAADLGDAAVYGLIVSLDSDPSVFQYSMPFHIKAGTETPETPETPEETGDDSEAPVLITTVSGVKTVTLTSCPPTETSTVVPTTSAVLNTTSIQTTIAPPPPTSTLITITSAVLNSTSIVVPTLPPTIVEPPVVPTTEIPPPAGTPTEIPESGAARLGSALFAVVGGVAAVLLL